MDSDSAKAETVVAEMNAAEDDFTHYFNATGRLSRENADLRARLAEIEALCDRWEQHTYSLTPGFLNDVRAAARGEGDRPHPFHMSSYVGSEPRCWCDRYASHPIHSVEGDQ